MHITSRQNQKLKHLRGLRRKKERIASGQCVVEGLRHVGEALAHGAEVVYVVHTPDLPEKGDYTQELLDTLTERGVELHTTPPDVFASLAEKELKSGILAVVTQKYTSLDEVSPDNAGWLCALARPQDPGNVGTLLRTIDAAGADGLILLDGGVDPYHPTSVRASMGTIFSKLLVQAGFDEFATWAKEHGYHVYGTSAKGAVDYRKATYERPAILLLGSEREGLREEELGACDVLVKLPMHGTATSLNVGVAGGILLYEMGKKISEL